MTEWAYARHFAEALFEELGGGQIAGTVEDVRLERLAQREGAGPAVHTVQLTQRLDRNPQADAAARYRRRVLGQRRHGEAGRLVQERAGPGGSPAPAVRS